MTLLLHLKPWQLFLTLVLLMILSSLPYIGIVASVIWVVGYFGWIYAIGTKMHRLIPAKTKPAINVFKVTSACTVFLFMAGGFINENTLAIPVWLDIVITILPFICFFYSVGFASQMLESMIEGEIVSFGGSVKCFILMWIFPIGIWFVQPAVQRVLAKYQDAPLDLPESTSSQ